MVIKQILNQILDSLLFDILLKCLFDIVKCITSNSFYFQMLQFALYLYNNSFTVDVFNFSMYYIDISCFENNIFNKLMILNKKSTLNSERGS